jgi:hypothetical protein
LEDALQKISILSPYLALLYLRKRVGYDGYLKKKSCGDSIKYTEWMGLLEDLGEELKTMENIPDWLEHQDRYRKRIQEISLTETVNRFSCKKAQSQKGVQLMTVHASKGLEFDHVILLDFNEGVIPNIKATDPELANEELIKYRNLAYVAITRARGRLLICTHGKPSRLIREMDRSLYLTDVTPGQQISEVMDGSVVKAIIQENDRETTITIDLKRFPNQSAIIGKTVGDVIQLPGINLNYKIVAIIQDKNPPKGSSNGGNEDLTLESSMKKIAPHVKEISSFFDDDDDLSKCFMELFVYQVSLCPDILFENRGTIIGFRCKGEYLRAYVGQAKDGSFFIKTKTSLESLPFVSTKVDNYKAILTQNNATFEKNIDKYLLTEEENTNQAKKSNVQKSREKTKESTISSSGKPTVRLKDYFEGHGFKTIDCRESNGCLWVIGEQKKLEPFVNEAIKKYSVSGAYGTGRAASYKPAWWTKSNR